MRGGEHDRVEGHPDIQRRRTVCLIATQAPVAGAIAMRKVLVMDTGQCLQTKSAPLR